MSIERLFPIGKWSFKSESVLAGLPVPEYTMLFEGAMEYSYPKGQVLFREGAFPNGIYFIKEGKVKKCKLGPNGKEHIIYVANRGELVGYHAVLSEDYYPDSCVTLEASQIVFISREQFLRSIRQSALLNRRLLKTLSHEFAVLINGLSLFTQKSVRQRLALQLIVIREKYKEKVNDGKPVVVTINREDLANLVGTARENVVRLLSDFKGKGILDTQGSRIVIHDVNALIGIADYR